MSHTPPGSPSTVLIVEDDGLVRTMAAEMLESGGFRVVEASDADAAWRLLEQWPDIRVVFTDVDMPGSMDGFMLARRVAERWPYIRLVVTSGRCLPKLSDVPDVGRFVPKPYRIAQVLRAIREAG